MFYRLSKETASAPWVPGEGKCPLLLVTPRRALLRWPLSAIELGQLGGLILIVPREMNYKSI